MRGHPLIPTWTMAMLFCLFAPALSAQVPGMCQQPAAERTSEIGCYWLADVAVGDATKDTHWYWHLYRYPTLEVAQVAQEGEGTALQAHGQAWLLRVAPLEWQPMGGERIDRIGPLPVESGVHYTARFMEAITPPGMKTRIHRHSGPEAFYMLQGAQCVQTPAGNETTLEGKNGVTPADTAMTLTGIGATMRRSMVLVLHDASKPWMTMVDDWRPQQGCEG